MDEARKAWIEAIAGSERAQNSLPPQSHNFTGVALTALSTFEVGK